MAGDRLYRVALLEEAGGDVATGVAGRSGDGVQSSRPFAVLVPQRYQPDPAIEVELARVATPDLPLSYPVGILCFTDIEGEDICPTSPPDPLSLRV